jgi:hypothetical protein
LIRCICCPSLNIYRGRERVKTCIERKRSNCRKFDRPYLNNRNNSFEEIRDSEDSNSNDICESHSIHKYEFYFENLRELNIAGNIFDKNFNKGKIEYLKSHITKFVI